MKKPLQVTFRNMQASAAVEARIKSEAAKLDRYYPRVTSCRVIVEAPHRHQKRGELFHVCIELRVPCADLVVRHEPTLHRTSKQLETAKFSKRSEIQAPHKDVYVAVRDAFKAARRQLEAHVRRMRGDVKMHARVAPYRAAKQELPGKTEAVM
jgi:ribosome-associated translation inhibitor RaiA